MSFDLAVWYSEKALSDVEALHIYERLCEEWPFLEGTSQNVENFYKELTEIWPEIDTIPEDRVGDFDFCPWSCSLNHSGMAVVMSCVWPKAVEVAKRVMGLAETHNLLLFDPQTGLSIHPRNIRKSRWQWWHRLLGMT